MAFGFGKNRGLRQKGRKDLSGQIKMMGRWGQCGPPTNCICPNCGNVVPHERGVPCFQRQCPKCGSFMARQFLDIE
ncbi:MAG: hypothetical protein BWX58_00673 [Deltaproteobacteria bacterium ADurb.Bin026]|nr:MAG: hypothetical protein BWX58_00673 [Deltaproteobacteria bacterium ADurb.Bin026]HNQ64098.1 hypothetical protein [Syntrophorhabdaceae bacterium]